MKTLPYSKKEKAQSLVELGVSLLFFLLLLAGIVDLGRVAIDMINIRDAAEEGAIYGSMSPSDCSEISRRVFASSTGMLNLSQDTVNITIDNLDCVSAAATTGHACGSPDPANPHLVIITVTQSAFPITMPFLGTVLGKQSLSLSATAKNAIIRPVCP